MTDSAQKTEVPGQGVLPGFEEILRIESARLKKPEQEAFCWEFVTNGGKPGPAYQVAINPKATSDNARKRASDLLKKQDITGRIQEISSIIQRKYENEVIAFRIQTMNQDPGVYYKKGGNIKRVHEMNQSERRGISLEAKIVDGCLHYIPVFPSPEKAADALQKMFGMNKDRTEITGRDGQPIAVETISRPQLSREEWLAIHGLAEGRKDVDTTAGTTGGN